MHGFNSWTQPKEEAEYIQGMFFLEGFCGLPNLHMDCPVVITLVYVLQNGILTTDDQNTGSKLLSLRLKKYNSISLNLLLVSLMQTMSHTSTKTFSRIKLGHLEV